MEQPTGNKSMRVLGMILGGVGGICVLSGLFWWMVMLATTTTSDGESDLVSNLVGGAICCFGPFAFAGAILGVVGLVLWYNSRQ